MKPDDLSDVHGARRVPGVRRTDAQSFHDRATRIGLPGRPMPPLSDAGASDVPAEGREQEGPAERRVAIEALARVLADTSAERHDTTGNRPCRHCMNAWEQAERLVGHPHLLAALADAGILTRVTDSLPPLPRANPMIPRGAHGGVWWAAERYVSEWRPDSKFGEEL